MSDVTEITNLVATGNETRSDDSGQLDRKLDSIAANVESMSKDMGQLIAMLNGPTPFSQSNYNNFQQQYRDRQFGRDTSYNGNLRGFKSSWNNFSRDNRDPAKGFLDAFEDELMGSLAGSTLKKDINSIFRKFAESLKLNPETEINRIPDMIGKHLGAAAKNSLKKNIPGLDSAVQDIAGSKANIIDAITKHGTSFISDLTSGGATLESVGSSLVTNLGQIGDAVVAEGSTLGPALASLGPYALAAAAALLVVNRVLESFQMAMEAAQKATEAMSQAMNRDITSRKKAIDSFKTRMEADYRTMVEYPFQLLQEAAKSLYNSWNTNLATVSATQGYTKADVQDLMSVFAQRLRDEGLSSYISGSDMFDNLAKVLDAGMSGAVAEEFAYQATVLNKAIPTQDFFSYASTYASIAANAIRNGQSQNQAIQTANKSLQSFANGLLYASRELTGGFSTGLKDASTLYEQSAKIALAAKSDNTSNIAGVLLAVQGYVGAVAPDIASQITDSVYKALTGGNSSDIVALRSLAGVNASNTEFLREFAKNPQKIFANLFDNLAKMYTQSNDAYMEKAEGYAQLFGLSSEAFQRVDFAELASAIRNMNMSSSALNENMTLLMEGQTTTTAEQLKAQQINQYMIDEGLAYVIDNEAAQMIQQHMWDEQLARELQETTYSVGLVGGAMDALETLRQSVMHILTLINPSSRRKKAASLAVTVGDKAAIDADIKQMLELGKVGNGNATQLYQLTTRNADLNVARSLVEQMGGVSKAEQVNQLRQKYATDTEGYAIADASSGVLMLGKIAENITTRNNAINAANAAKSDAAQGLASSPSSRYAWGSSSKSAAAAASTFLDYLNNNPLQSNISNVTTESGSSAASASANAVKSAVESMLDEKYMVDQFVKQGKSYEEWAASASKYGISDLSSALKTIGYNETDVRGYFEAKETEQGAEELASIAEEEKRFRDAGLKFWETDFPFDFRDPLFTSINTITDNLKTIIENQQAWQTYFTDTWVKDGWNSFVSKTGYDGWFNKLYKEFMNYFIDHKYYSETTGYTYSDVEAIQNAKQEQDRGDTVFALADMLTKNLMNLEDPQMQTNALLAQILRVVSAIMAQNNNIPEAAQVNSLVGSLAGLATGLIDNGLGTGGSDTQG